MATSASAITALGHAAHVGPVAVEDKAAAGKFGQIARAGVIGDVALEEIDMLAASPQRRDQPPPKRRVTVAPGGADGEAEDRHAS